MEKSALVDLIFLVHLPSLIGLTCGNVKCGQL